MEQNLIQNILGVLSKHPEGLTISSLANKTGIHRHTATKYIKDLILSGEVQERRVGMAKLCFLAKYKSVHKIANKAEMGQFQIFLLTIFLLIIPVLIIAQNIDNSSNDITSNFLEIIDTFPITSSSDIILTTTTIENQELSTVENEQNYNTNNMEYDYFSTVANTQNIENESSYYIEILENQMSNNSLEIENQNLGSIVETNYEKIKIEFDYQQKTTRISNFLVKARLTSNIHGLKNIYYEWIVPNEFIVLNEKTNKCELDFQQFCDIELLLDIKSSDLGVKKIKLVVSYE